MATSVFTQARPMEAAITTPVAAARLCWAHISRASVCRDQEPLTPPEEECRLGGQAGEQKVDGEDVDRERIAGVIAKKVAGERHDGDGEQEGEVPPDKTLPLAGDLTEHPIVDKPEVGDDVERDNVTDQLVSVVAKLRGEFGG